MMDTMAAQYSANAQPHRPNEGDRPPHLAQSQTATELLDSLEEQHQHQHQQYSFHGGDTCGKNNDGSSAHVARGSRQHGRSGTLLADCKAGGSKLNVSATPGISTAHTDAITTPEAQWSEYFGHGHEHAGAAMMLWKRSS